MLRVFSIALIIFIFNGCSTSQKLVYVPQKCSIPKTEEPNIDNNPCSEPIKLDWNDKSFQVWVTCFTKKSMTNYEKQKEYSEKLLKNSEVCE